LLQHCEDDKEGLHRVLYRISASWANLERRLLDATAELTCKKLVVPFVELPGAQPFDWDGIIEAMRDEAIAEFMTFYYSAIETLGDQPDLRRACTLPAGPNSGESVDERMDAFGASHVTRGPSPKPEQYKSTTQPLQLSSDEEDVEGVHGKGGVRPTEPTFRNDGDSFNCFVNCMLWGLFILHQFWLPFRACMRIPRGHRCKEPQENCMACQLLKLTDDYRTASANAVLNPTTLLKAVHASTDGRMRR
jgi:hypothetical protein